MKKRLSCLVLVVMYMLAFSGHALAASGNAIVPCGIVGLTSGLPKVAGTTNTYEPWVGALAALPEDLRAGFELYRIENGEEVYITSKSVSEDNTTYIKAEQRVILSPGEYKLYAWYIGETQSDGEWKTYTIR